jgi:N-acyl-L-homoserine lactone synthetase
MDADIKGCLNQIDRSWKAFEHNGKRMTKTQVKTILEYGLSKGYKSVSQITDEEVERLINQLS